MLHNIFSIRAVWLALTLAQLALKTAWSAEFLAVKAPM